MTQLSVQEYEPLEECPSCGAPLGGREGCQLAFDQLSARAWSDGGFAAVHNLVVDLYALQHVEAYCESPKSYAAHLLGLCSAVEHGGDPNLYRAIARWLDGRVKLVRPPTLEFRGSMTIADIVSTSDPDVYRKWVFEWADNVWDAYRSQHEIARQNLVQVLVSPGGRDIDPG